MKKNMGSTDKIIRILIALVIGVLYYTETIRGTTAITSFISFCPLYLPFGINTSKKS